MTQLSFGNGLPRDLVLHNVGEVAAVDGGVALYRVPRMWRHRFPEQTAWRGEQAAGIELRLCADTRFIRLDLAVAPGIADSQVVALYHGVRNVSMVSLAPEHSGPVVLLDRDASVPDPLGAPWRILMPYGAHVTLRSLHLGDGVTLHPVQPRKVRWLAHGDSITQGARALAPGLTYVHLVADALGWDAINLGFGGSAWGDAVVAEYIASRDDWNVLSIAIGTNTFGGSTESAEQYGKRYARFLEIVRAGHPAKPILCITPIWRLQDGPPEQPNACGDVPDAYRRAINDVVRGRQVTDSSLYLMDGLDLIGDGRGLTVDRVHPDGHGMFRMAEGIAARLSNLL